MGLRSRLRRIRMGLKSSFGKQIEKGLGMGLKSGFGKQIQQGFESQSCNLFQQLASGPAEQQGQLW